MAIKLVRESSETPNITSRDDVRMIRYAYGGYDGIIKEYGEEFECTSSYGSIKIGSGRAVINGWEIDIDGSGVTLDLSSLTGYQKCTVYLELNTVSESAEIKSLYSSGGYPEVEHGDDLTTYPYGTARIVLYHIDISNGSIVEITRIAKIIDYTKNLLEDLEKRLEEQGFRSASVSTGEISLNTDWTDAVPSYIMGQISGTSDPVIDVEKIGKLCHLQNLNVATHVAATGSGTNSLNVSGVVATLPEIFRPETEIKVSGLLTFLCTDSIFGRVDVITKASLTIDTSGKIAISSSASSSTPIVISSTYPVVVQAFNLGWRIP